MNPAGPVAHMTAHFFALRIEYYNGRIALHFEFPGKVPVLFHKGLVQIAALWKVQRDQDQVLFRIIPKSCFLKNVLIQLYAGRTPVAAGEIEQDKPAFLLCESLCVGKIDSPISTGISHIAGQQGD